MLNDFREIAVLLEGSEVQWWCGKGTLLGANWVSDVLRWDEDLDVFFIPAGIRVQAWWSERWPIWQSAFAARGWEATKRSSIYFNVCTGAAPMKAGHNSDWSSAIDQAAIQLAEEGGGGVRVRAKLAKKLRSSKKQIKQRASLHMDVHVVRNGKSGKLFTSHNRNGDPVNIDAGLVLPTKVVPFGKGTIQVPKQNRAVPRLEYGKEPRPHYRLKK